MAAAALFVSGAAHAQIVYEARIDGLDKDPALLKDVKGISRLVAERRKRPDTLFMLEDRARDDAGRVRQYLRGEGYFAARVSQSVIPGPNEKQAVATLTVAPGPRYLLTAPSFVFADGRQQPAPDGPAIGLVAGRPGRSETILEAQTRLVAWYAAQAYPFVKVTERRVTVDHAKRTVAVRFSVSRGRRVRVGTVEVRGAEGVKRWIIRRRIAFRRGDWFTSKSIAATRQSLLDLGVFSAVNIAADPEGVTPDGSGRIIVTLDERKRRTLSVRAYYDTSLGIGGDVEWMHRNLFGAAERLRLRVGGTFVEYGARALFEKPDVFDSPYSFAAEARYNELDAPAYKGREAVLTLAMSRQFDKRLSMRAGPVFDWSKFDENDGGETYRLVGLDLQLLYDASDDKLDPKSGYRLRFGLQPYGGSRLSFVRATAMASAYWTPGRQTSFTLAAWTRLATVVGEEVYDLPPNKRLFAGGGSSIRGFSYQRVGPLNSANNPIGGRSLIEGGLEARVRFTPEWGAVAFVEAGTVNLATMPDFDEPVQVGVGVGLRYNSPVGLIRVDVATPIKRRKGDSFIQVYVSIGQAF